MSESRDERVARRDVPFDRLVAAYSALLDPLEAMRAALDLMSTERGEVPAGPLALRQLARIEATAESLSDALLELRGVLAADVATRARAC